MSNYYLWVSFAPLCKAEDILADMDKATSMEQKVGLAKRLGKLTTDDPLVPPQIGPFMMAPKGPAPGPGVCFGISKEYGTDGWKGKGLDCNTSPMFFPDADSAQAWFKKYGAEALDTKNAVVYFLATITA